MKELVELIVDEVMNGYNSLTWLCLFMIAAIGKYHDLNGLYGIMRMSPTTNDVVAAD